MRIVFTGTFKVGERHITRDKLIAGCRDRGWTVDSKVTPATDFLVRLWNLLRGPTSDAGQYELGYQAR